MTQFLSWFSGFLQWQLGTLDTFSISLGSVFGVYIIFRVLVFLLDKYIVSPFQNRLSFERSARVQGYRNHAEKRALDSFAQDSGYMSADSDETWEDAEADYYFDREKRSEKMQKYRE